MRNLFLHESWKFSKTKPEICTCIYLPIKIKKKKQTNKQTKKHPYKCILVIDQNSTVQYTSGQIPGPDNLENLLVLVF